MVFMNSYAYVYYVPHDNPQPVPNARTSANIPFVNGDWSPLSFADVPRQIHTEAVLGVYELTKIDLFKDVFIWAYGLAASLGDEMTTVVPLHLRR
jgi:hypothetical protein